MRSDWEERFKTERLPQINFEKIQHFRHFHKKKDAVSKSQIREEYTNARREEQNGLCAICNEVKDLCSDHNHDSGLFRGLLCGTCNSMLGFAHDKVSVLIAGARYLRHWERRHKKEKA